METETLQKKKTKVIPKLRFNEFDGNFKKVKLGEVVSLLSGFAFKGEKFTEQGKKVLIPKNFTQNGYGNFKNGFLKFTSENPSEIYECRKGDLMVLLTDLTPTCDLLGKPLWIREEDVFLLNQRIVKLQNDEDKLHRKFLLFCLQTENYHRKIVETATGSTVRHSSNKILLQSKLILPSLPEQQKIASFLFTVDKKILQLIQKKELLETYKKGLMQQLFSQEIRFKDEDGKDFPVWDKKKLGELADRITLKNTEYKVNFVLTNSATQGIISQNDYFDRDIANQNNLQGYYVVSKNDFVYNPRISVHAPVGPIKRNKLKEGVMSPLYSVFRFKDAKNLVFFEYYFETVEWHKYLNSVANFGARHDRMNISLNDFYLMPIPFPPVNERQKIADFLSAIDKKIEAVSQQIEKTQSFKKGLLQQMFV